MRLFPETVNHHGAPDRPIHFPDEKTLAPDYLHSTADRIRNFPIFFLHKGVATIEDSRNMAGLVVAIAVRFRNVSTKRWLPSGASTGSVNIGYFIHDLAASTRPAKGKEYRFHLSDGEVKPGDSVDVRIDLGALNAGRYRVDIDLVSENVRWFHANGSKIATVNLTVS